MACYYYIKLPGGGQVKVPASLVPINDSDKDLYASLQKEIESFYEVSKQIKDDSKLIDKILEFDTGLQRSIIKSVIKKSKKDTLINNLNRLLEGSSRNVGLIEALRKNVFYKSDKILYQGPKATKYTEITFNTFLDKLNDPIQKKYLSKINYNGLKGINSPLEIINDLDDKQKDLRDLSINHEGIKLIKDLMNNYYRGDDRKTQIFFNLEFDSDTYDAVVVKDENVNGHLIFYNNNNDLSLFMGLIKSISTKINKEDLLKILTEYNKSLNEKLRIDLTDLDVEKFFIGYFTEDNEFVDPEFNKIFRYKNSAKTTINKLVDLIAPIISKKEEDINSIKRGIHVLFRLMDSNKLESKITAKQKQESKQYISEVKEDIELAKLQKSNSILPLIDSSVRDYYYGKKITKLLSTPEDIYNYLRNNINFEEDLILVDIKDKVGDIISRYIVPYNNMVMNSKGVTMSGYYVENGKYIDVPRASINLNRELNRIKQVDEPDAKKEYISRVEVAYRKLENKNTLIEEKNAEALAKSESIIIVSDKDEYLPPDLIKDATIRGATVTYDYFDKKSGTNKQYARVVKQVFPNAILGNDFLDRNKKLHDKNFISTDKVKTIETHRSLFEDEFTEAEWQQKTEILKTHDNISTGRKFFPIQKGDYIGYNDGKSNKYNKVLSVTDDLVYILIKRNEKYVIKPIKKSLITNIFKSKHHINTSEIKIIDNVYKKIQSDESIKEFEYSSFSNYEFSVNGDYLILPQSQGITKIYKIINKENREAIEFILDSQSRLNYKYVTLPEVNEGTFITTRDIFSKFGWNTAEMNNVYVSVEQQKLSPNEEWVEAKYIIPEQYDINELDILKSGNILRGKVLVENQTIDPGFKDVTDDLIIKLSEKRNVDKPEGLFIKRKGKYWIRYNANLYQTDYTSDKNKFVKENSFVVLTSEQQTSEGYSKSGNKTYRVIGRSNEKVTLEYNAFNKNGKLLTIIKELKIDEFSEKIKWLYVMKESPEHYQLKEIQSKKEVKEVEKQAKQKSIDKKELYNTLQLKFQKIFKIKVELQNHDSGQFKNKKAWINADPLGKPTIVLNTANINTSEEDLIHEYLHLFLIALKYNETDPKGPSSYEKLLLDYKNSFEGKTSEDPKKQQRIDSIANTNNINTLEEFFVQDISKIMVEQNYQDLDEFNFDNFYQAINNSLESLEVENTTPFADDLFGILTHKMSSIFPRMRDSQMSNNSLILFDANFRDWLDNQINKKKIEILCQ